MDDLQEQDVVIIVYPPYFVTGSWKCLTEMAGNIWWCL
jgi:hypothetical protein